MISFTYSILAASSIWISSSSSMLPVEPLRSPRESVESRLAEIAEGDRGDCDERRNHTCQSGSRKASEEEIHPKDVLQ